MKILRDTRAWPAALAAAALLSAPIAAAQTEPKPKTASEKCAEILEKNYGVTEVGGVNRKNTKSRNSVYADGTLATGETVRFRCLFSERSTPEIQAYTAPPLGSPNPGKQWGSADAFQVPAAPPAEPQETETAGTGTAPDGTAPPEGKTPPEGATPPEGTEPQAQTAPEDPPEEPSGPKRLRPPQTGS